MIALLEAKYGGKAARGKRPTPPPELPEEAFAATAARAQAGKKRRAKS